MGLLLEVRNLTINFRTELGILHAIRNVSFTLSRGETLAIVGESGCGKTVLCKSIAGILPSRGYCAGGDALLDGVNLEELSEKSWNQMRGKEISMILQNPFSSFNPAISIGRQIMEAILVHNPIRRREAKKQVLNLMAMVGIVEPEQRFHQFPYQLSGGMLQRSAIAAALACNPKLLVADEPTTALDPCNQSEILSLLRRLQKESELSLLFITHDLAAAFKIAHRVAVMYAGKIVEIGTIEDIFYDPRHPYTCGLIQSLPTYAVKGRDLNSIPGVPPNLLYPPKGDAFAARNPNALLIDFKEEPPMFQISDTHFAATWLLDPNTPKSK